MTRSRTSPQTEIVIPTGVARSATQRRDLLFSRTPPNPTITNLGLILFGALMLEFCHLGNAEAGHFTIGFSAVAFAQAILFTAAVWAILTQPTNRYTFPIIIVFAVACRLVLLFHDPFLSSDVYRYIWDGRVQAAHINPYRYVASDPHLKFLVDNKIFPHMNRRDYAHTIYPPGAQFFYLLITRISESITWMKTAMVGFEVLTGWALLDLLRDLNLRREYLLIYAWNPLLLWEVASSGHMDAMAIAFMTFALLFRLRNQPVLTGLALGMATLTKLYPIILLPALFRKKDWKMPLYCAALIAFGYACYSSVGTMVLGFLPNYVQEEGMRSGSRYFLLTLTRNLTHIQSIPTAAYLAFSALIFAALSIWAYRRSTHPTAFIASAFVFASALMLLFSPHYPWYFLWIIPFTVLIPYVPAIFYITACFFLYTTEFAAPGPKMYYMNEWLYGTLLVAVATDWARRRWMPAREESPAYSTSPLFFARHPDRAKQSPP
jgi:alpha-1,6-mannosyltransferase